MPTAIICSRVNRTGGEEAEELDNGQLRRAGKGYVLGVSSADVFRSWGKRRSVAGTSFEMTELNSEHSEVHRLQNNLQAIGEVNDTG